MQGGVECVAEDGDASSRTPYECLFVKIRGFNMSIAYHRALEIGIARSQPWLEW
jgi:hypothetical protein